MDMHVAIRRVIVTEHLHRAQDLDTGDTIRLDQPLCPESKRDRITAMKGALIEDGRWASRRGGPWFPVFKWTARNLAPTSKLTNSQRSGSPHHANGRKWADVGLPAALEIGMAIVPERRATSAIAAS
jgi:hypothetical protein